MAKSTGVWVVVGRAVRLGHAEIGEKVEKSERGGIDSLLEGVAKMGIHAKVTSEGASGESVLTRVGDAEDEGEKGLG